MSTFNHLFITAIRDLATAYNSRDIQKLTQFYGSQAVSSQYAPQLFSTYTLIPNVLYIPQILRLFLEKPWLRLATRGISGTQELMAWEWEYTFFYNEPEPHYPGIPTGRLLTMRGVSLIRFYVENRVCKVVSQREYASLVDWTNGFSEPWPNVK